MENRDNVFELDQLVLDEFPYPVAIRYKQMLAATDWRTRVQWALLTFEFGLRTLALGVISQYLLRDAGKISDPTLNSLLHYKFRKPSLGTWKQILFSALNAYQGKRDLFFVKELYDLYWDTSHEPHESRPGVQGSYDRLIEIRNDIAHGRTTPITDAEWQPVFEKILPDLRAILSQFSFLRDLDVIRITEKRADRYDYAVYTGLEIRTVETPLVSQEALTPSWFYLLNKEGKLLALHPMFNFMEDIESVSVDAPDGGALYDSMSKSKVHYIRMVIQGMMKDMALVDEFARLFSAVIDRVQERRAVSQELTWTLLNSVAKSIAERRFQDVVSKYKKQLYLQRAEVRAYFDQFLASKQAAFLLLGKSGIGKSSFFISLAEEYQKQDQVCLLLYNGAKLETDRPLIDTITRDVNTYLHLQSDRGEIEIADFLKELARVPDIQKRHVILFIDAVNENANPTELFRRIDALVESTAYSWFKVVFSSRPEAWKVMRKNVHPSEQHYFHVRGKDDMGVELQAFGVEMSRFTRKELQPAYEKYQDFYHVKTNYEDIPQALRLILNDPLTLKLVTSTYHGAAIPKTIRPGDVYINYVKQLISDGRLEIDDTQFLEHDLMPLMISAERFENQITSELVSSSTVGRTRLWERIYSDDPLKNGKAVNQSFQNLIETEILVLRGDVEDSEIGFKYERFYDYYGGKQLNALIESQGQSNEAFFRSLIQQTSEKPFRWGPVKNAVIVLIKNGEIDLIYRLALTEHERTKELISAALIDHGRDDDAAVKRILRKFLERYSQSARQTKADMMPALIALEVARHLLLMDVLEEMALSNIEELRVTAVQHLCYVGDTDPDKVVTVLTKIAPRSVNRWGVPNVSVAKSGAIISAALGILNADNKTLMLKVQSIWKPWLGKMMLVSPDMGSWQSRLKGIIRSVVMFATINVFFSYLKNFGADPKGNANLTMPEVDHFWKLPPDRRDLYRRLVPYVDPTHGHLSEIQSELLQAPDNPDVLTMYTVTFMLGVRGIFQQDEAIDTIKALFAKTANVEMPGPYPQALAAMIYLILEGRQSLGQQPDPALVELLGDFVWTSWDRHRGFWKSHLRTYQHPWIDRYFLEYGRLMQDTKDRVAPRLLERLEAEKPKLVDGSPHRYDYPFENQIFLHHYVLSYAGNFGGGFGQGELALALIRAALEKDDPKVHKAIMDADYMQEALINSLSTVRKSYPDQVDDFMEEMEFSARIQDQVKARTRRFSSIGLPQGYGAAIYPLIFNTPSLRSRVTDFLCNMANTKSASQAAEALVKTAFNFAYGEEVL